MSGISTPSARENTHSGSPRSLKDSSPVNKDTPGVVRHLALEAHRKIVNVPFLCLLIFNLFQHVDRFNIARLFMVKKTLPVAFLANTETFLVYKEFDVINVVNIRAASRVNLQKLIARGVVAKNLTAAA